MTSNEKIEVALFRYKLILPFLNESLNDSEKTIIRKKK